MLQIQNVSKQYRTGDLLQIALDHVSINLRDSEFVAVLGPSGSGKTTLLNVIGGLDRYDGGDLIINGVSTQRYKDRDWDSYRNHTVGFVFQSYNLIPHQSVLANVELALTISGISRAKRRQRAKLALEQVGLGDQLHKRPNQLSGGQMQRVAIARALVNDPDVLLADEPTGALDTETSLQVMELLKEVAKDRLVVMVTHNPDLARQYATRIVNLRDGRITGDSDPFEAPEQTEPVHQNMGHASMSFFTALALSFNNLRTKKGRTILTSFAGSIGIIGIALILSLSNGVNAYINDIQKSTMTSYPISVQAQTVDLSGFIESAARRRLEETDHPLDGIYADGTRLELASTVTASITKNNLTAFKKYLDDPDSDIRQYVGENGVIYSYDTRFEVYTYDEDDTFVNTNGSTLHQADSAFGGMNGGMTGMGGMNGGMAMFGRNGSHFEELLPGQNGAPVSTALTDAYEVLHGTWPAAYDEAVLVLDYNRELPATTLYQLGLLPAAEYNDLIDRINAGEEVTVPAHRLDFDAACKQVYYLLPACDTYVANDDGTFTGVADDPERLEKLLPDAMRLKIVGVICPTENSDNLLITEAVGYTQALTRRLMKLTDDSPVVKAQQASPDVNVLNGLAFAPADDAAKAADAAAYLAGLGVSEKANMMRTILAARGENDPTAAASMQADESTLAAMLDRFLQAPDQETLLKLYDAFITPGSYNDNMTAFGVVSADTPASVNIYADSFEAKEAIADCIAAYNRTAAEEDAISYTDYVGLLMSSVTTIINVISYVLIAFVAVSLVVSSIMIGIITYISVLERTKEIGILRAIGASKRNISQVFNAETFIIGLFAGLMGIGITLLLLIPGNAAIHAATGSANVNAALPPVGGAVLVILSVALTLIGGIIPSRKAAAKDPVTALRTE